MPGFRGPLRYIKKHKIFVPRKDSMIEEATLTIRGRTFILEENRFSVSVNPDSSQHVDVYHSYEYSVGDERCYGRWYNMEVPKEMFTNLPVSDVFEYICENYEVEDSDSEGLTTTTAILRVKFKPKAGAALRAI